MQLDAVIFGGGAAGLWLLDELVRRGRGCLLLEADRLGAGQTVASQGIIHGGLKYSLAGPAAAASARPLRTMPELWRDCLAGRRQPDLRGVRFRGEACYLWRSRSLAGRLGLLAARLGLDVTPTRLDPLERPAILADCSGPVARLDEPVIDPVGMLDLFARRHRDRLLLIDRNRVEFDTSGPGHVRTIRLGHPFDRLPGGDLLLEPRRVIFTAGAGNDSLRRLAALDHLAMQRRPLHMVLVRGDLPPLCGHQVDGARTRVTITADVDAAGRTVWQLGGQIAEAGVERDERSLLRHAAAELAEILPGLDQAGLEWATHRVDRAEASTGRGRRPHAETVLAEGNTLTAWPTKLALVPVLADRLVEAIEQAGPPIADPAIPGPAAWPRPSVASPPWETRAEWHVLQPAAGGRDQTRRAA